MQSYIIALLAILLSSVKAYIKGTCNPSGVYTFGQCCPSGYVEVETLEECEEAFQQLGLAGILWGGNAPRNARPTGCFIHLQNNYMHFNPTAVYGNVMTGDDEPICKLEKTMVAVELSSNALQVVTDIGEQAFNSKFKACPVVQYNRNGAVHSVYKRLTPIPDNFNAYKIFTETWRNTPTNTMGTDFEIFSNVNDLLNDQNQWTFCNYNDPDVAYPRDCGRHGWVGGQWFTMPGGRFNAPGITNGAGFTLFNECPIDFAFWGDCRWESNHDQTPNSADYMGWTCADDEILTGFGLSADQHDVTKVQCCKLGGHSAVKPNTCTYVDSNHERAKCGNGNDHMLFSGAYDKRAASVDAVTEILAGKCCEVECDSAWCTGKDWGVDKNNCQVISTSNTNAQELVCPSGTLMTEVEDGLSGNAHGVQKVASVTCCALDLIAPPSMAPSVAPTTARPTSVPTSAPSTSMPTLAPTSVIDCLLGLRDPQLTDSEYLDGIDRCLPGCRSQPYVPHRRALESRLLSGNNRRQ